MTVPLTVRAIDIGFGCTKFTIDSNFNCQLFPSLAPPADLHRSRGRLYRDRRTTDVWVEGQAYEVGPDTNLFSIVPVLHSEYIDTPQYRALLYGALDIMHVDRIDLLVTGLPVQLHATRAQKLQQLLVGVHTIRPGVTVEIARAAVVIQPLGGFISHSHERANWSTDRSRCYLLIDPGYLTFDWLVTKGLDEVPGKSGSIECGVSAYIHQIQNHLSAALGIPYNNPGKIDEALRGTEFRVQGRPIDLKPYRELAGTVLREAVVAVSNQVGIGEDIDEILLVGGGARYYLPYFQAAFPKHPISAVRESVTANVRGFARIGTAMLASKGT